MGRTFGRQIEQFIMTNDIMDDDVFEDLMNLIALYLQKDLGISHFALLMEGIVNNKPGLETKWCMTDVRSAYSMPADEESGYESHSTYSFGKDVPLWVVSDSGEPLRASDTWKEHWSKNGDLPRDDGIPDGIRTSIRHPVKRGGKAVGVIEIASERYVEPTPISCQEITKLAQVIEKAYAKADVRKMQRANTRHVISFLEKALDNEIWTRLALPKIFVAFSGGSSLEAEAKNDHDAVISTIREVVNEFDGVLEAVFWDEIEESGNITMQIIREINVAEYGICYFSEPGEDGTYSDNPNVLFEAGMMQALQNSPGVPLKGWIPIREKASTELPFDIATERILLVNREEDSALSNLALALKNRIEKLIDSDEAA